MWRAVDHEGEVLEAVITKGREKKAALKVLKNLMKRYGRPKVIVTDRLKSYPAALKDLNCNVKHEVGRRTVCFRRVVAFS
jgi:putative transposase